MEGNDELFVPPTTDHQSTTFEFTNPIFLFYVIDIVGV